MALGIARAKSDRGVLVVLATLLSCAAMALLFTAPAMATTQIGETFTPTTSCGANFRYFQTTSSAALYAVPTAGVITGWQYQAGLNSPSLKFKVARPAGGNDLTIVGESQLETATAGQLNAFSVSIPVHAGDVIGARFASPGECLRPAADFGHLFGFGADPSPGVTSTYSAGSGFQFDLAATLEPDCDGDGLGDESQDLDILSCDRSPPETTITKEPPKTVKKTKVKYGFKSSESGATFECKLDKQDFRVCSSPQVYKHLGHGKHKFQVRATDASGNIDPTPDKDRFKRVS